MKKWILLLIGLMLSTLLAACGSNQGGENSSHPYTWKEKGNGSVRVTIQNAPEDGYSWTYEGTGDGLIQVERLDSGNGKKATFSVTGEDFSSGTVTFSCRRDTAPYDTSFQLNMAIGASEKGKLQVLSADYVQLPAGGSAGEEGKTGCMWYATEDNTCELFLDSVDGNWSVMGYDSSILSVDGPSYEEDGCAYELSGLASGATELLLYDLKESYGFQFSISVDEELTVTITDGQAGTFEVPTEQVPGMADAVSLVGELALGDGMELLSCQTGSWNGGETEDYAKLQFRADGAKWYLIVTQSYSVDDLISSSYGSTEEVPQADTKIGKYSAKICGVDENLTLFWSDNQGRSFVLSAFNEMEGMQKALTQVAEDLCAAQKEGT